jgi:hypothetical protein
MVGASAGKFFMIRNKIKFNNSRLCNNFLISHYFANTISGKKNLNLPYKYSKSSTALTFSSNRGF